MRIVRFRAEREVKYGSLEDNVVHGLRHDPFAEGPVIDHSFAPDGSTYSLDAVRLLAPCLPSKIVGVGMNYLSALEAVKMAVPPDPILFFKPSTAVIGPDDHIVLPPESKRVDYEGELGVVIGRRAKDVSEDKAKDYIFGCTCINDVTERAAQREGQAAIAKGCDTFAPIGPWIETEVDPHDLQLEVFLNGELRQSVRTSELVFGIARIIAFASRRITLLPGDVIATGTPWGISRMSSGDVVEVRIEKVGSLKNTVVHYSDLCSGT